MEKPLTARLFTVEMIIWLCTTIFLFGVGYAVLATESDSHTRSIDDLRGAEKEIIRNISEIKISIGSIHAQQKFMADHIVQQESALEKRMDRQESDIRDILGILRTNHEKVHP